MSWIHAYIHFLKFSKSVHWITFVNFSNWKNKSNNNILLTVLLTKKKNTIIKSKFWLPKKNYIIIHAFKEHYDIFMIMLTQKFHK